MQKGLQWFQRLRGGMRWELALEEQVGLRKTGDAEHGTQEGQCGEGQSWENGVSVSSVQLVRGR